MHPFNAWQVAIALLLGTHHVPASPWPPELVHVYVLAPDTEPDIELDPLPPEPAALRPVEVDVLAVLALEGTASERDLARALDMGRQRVRTGLHALKARGLVRMAAKGWRTA